MRLLVLENEPSSARGGQELSLLDVCCGLAARGHRIDLLYITPGDLLQGYRKFCSRMLRVSGYSIDRRRTLRSSSRWVGSFVRAALQVGSTDLIYANQYHDSLFAGMLGQVLGKPVVCHLRLAPPDFCGQWRIGMSRVTTLIAISQFTKNAWAAAGFDPNDIDVVYNGIDLEQYKPSGCRATMRSILGLTEDTFAVLFVGRVDPAKGLEVLLSAFGLVCRRLPHAQLLIAGGPLQHASASAAATYVEQLHRLAQSLGIADRVRWLGRRSDVPALCEACDILVLPSRCPEAFGRTLIEAMACGTPAVGARVAGIPEVLHSEFSGCLFPDGDSEALADILIKFATWRQEDSDLGNRCRRHVLQHFSLEQTIAGIEASFQRTLGSDRHAAKMISRGVATV